MIIFLDTETTGLFEYGTPLSPETTYLFPYIVQLAYQLRNDDGTLVESYCEILQPNGISIPRRSIEIHGITMERALKEGKKRSTVLMNFRRALNKADFVVAHNYDYDAPVVGAEFLRFGDINRMGPKPAFCTQKQTTNFCKIPKGKANGHGKYKWPSLAELHRICGFGNITGAHDALADVDATQKCFFHILNAAPETFSQPYKSAAS